MQSYIKTIDRINDQHSVALIHVVHAPEEDIRDNFAASVSAATKNDLSVVPGSCVVIEEGRGNTMIRTLLNRVEEIIPIESASAAGIHSISANMYVDRATNVWTVRSSDAGDVLVREAAANDNEELIGMIRSVSSASETTLRSNMPETAAALNAFEQSLCTAEGGDMITFLSNSNVVEAGFVGVRLTDEASGDVSYLVVSKSGNEETISPRSVVTILGCDEIEANAFPAIDSVSAALGVNVEKLVDYYRRVFSYSPEYLAKLEQRIRQHAF